MKNVNKNMLAGSLFVLLTTPAFSGAVSLENESVHQSSRSRGLGLGSIAISNEGNIGSGLLNATNGVGEAYQAGGEFDYCNTSSKTDGQEEKVKGTCSNVQAYGLIPIKKLSGAQNTSGVGVILEKANYKIDLDERSATEDNLNLTAFGSVGIKNFDIGLKYKLKNSEIKNELNTLEALEGKDTYGQISLSTAMNVSPELRVAAIITPETLHTVDLETENGVKKTNVEGAPLSYAIAGAYKLEEANVMLTGGLGKETAKSYEYKDEAGIEQKESFNGYTTVSLGAEMDMGMFKPRAGMLFRSGRNESAQSLSIGTDVMLSDLAITSDVSYGSRKDTETFQNQDVETKSNLLAMSLGVKAQF